MFAWMFSFQVIAFDDLKTDYKNPIDLCQSLNPVCISDRKLFNMIYWDSKK